MSDSDSAKEDFENYITAAKIVHSRRNLVIKALKSRCAVKQLCFWTTFTTQAQSFYNKDIGISKKHPSSIAMEMVTDAVMDETTEELNRNMMKPDFNTDDEKEKGKLVVDVVKALFDSLGNLVEDMGKDTASKKALVQPLLNIPCVAGLEKQFNKKCKKEKMGLAGALNMVTEIWTKCIVQYLAAEIEQKCSYKACAKQENIGAAEDPETVFDKMMKCGRCKSVRYCGKDCQVADWARHKKECIQEGRKVQDKN